MADYNITIDLSSIAAAAESLEAQTFERLHASVGVVAEHARERWIEAVRTAPGIWLVERQQYMASISWHYTSPYTATVGTTLPAADEIENGRPARDLKKMLQTSSKVRRGKKGRYLIIPFRHNVPSASGQGAYAPQMPKDVYTAAKKLTPSRVTGAGIRVSGLASPKLADRWQAVAGSRAARGAGPRGKYLVAQHTYQWSGRLPAGMAPKLKPTHATDPYAGMVRFDTSTGKSKSSAYLTFRVMSENQPGKWIVAAKPGLHLAKKVSDGVKAEIEAAMKA